MKGQAVMKHWAGRTAGAVSCPCTCQIGPRGSVRVRGYLLRPELPPNGNRTPVASVSRQGAPAFSLTLPAGGHGLLGTGGCWTHTQWMSPVASGCRSWAQNSRRWRQKRVSEVRGLCLINLFWEPPVQRRYQNSLTQSGPGFPYSCV